MSRSSSSAASSSEPSTRHSIRSTAASAASTAGRWRSERKYERSRAQIPCTTDVQHLVARAAEEVDPRPCGAPKASARLSYTRRRRGAASSQRSPTVHAPRSCASPMSPTRISAVACASGSARWHGRTDVPKNCESDERLARRTRPASRRRARATVSITGPARRRPVRRSTSRPRKATSKRALCATSTASPENARKPTNRRARGRRSTQVGIPQPGQRTDGRRQGSLRVDERLKVPVSMSPSTRTAPISQSDALPGRSPVVSTSTTTYRAASTGRSTCPARARASLSPRQARRASPLTTSSRRLRASPTGTAESAKRRAPPPPPPSGAPLLDQLDEPVGRVERELHPVQDRRTYVRLQGLGYKAQQTGPPRAAPRSGERRGLRASRP